MKMAKANENDLNASLEMCRALESLENGYLPDEMTPGDDGVAYYADEHAEQVIEHLVGIAKRASIFRVCFGMTVLLDPENNIINQKSSSLELHPRLALCSKVCQGIADDKLQSWLNPPEGQLGTHHGTWAQQLAAAGDQLIRRQRDQEEMLAALKDAKNVIKTWHGEDVWEIYDQHAPEMKSINAAISKAEAAS